MAMTCTLTTPSPFGDALCFLSEHQICRRQVRGNDTHLARPLGYHQSEIKSLKWSTDGSKCLVTSTSGLKVIGASDLVELARLDNGTGGAGRIDQAEFVGNGKLLTTWEFGTAKLWDLPSGKAIELPDCKTTSTGTMLQLRPQCEDGRPNVVALISRNGAEDVLNLLLPDLDRVISSVRLQTIDAQSLSWSPDGRWLSVLDTPSADSNLHIYTPDGHRFRSYPATKDLATDGLGTKAIAWSPDGLALALAQFSGEIELLNTKTFSPIARMEHSLTVDQRTLPSTRKALVWIEQVSASNEHSYTAATQPVPLPLTRSKPVTEPAELGVAEMCFSCSGEYLATRDTRMLNTVWIWNITTLAAHAVVIQHNPIRELLWHPTRSDTLMIDCGDGIASIYAVMLGEPPASLATTLRPKASLSWIFTTSNGKPIVLAAEKTTYRLLYPEGRDDLADSTETGSAVTAPTYEDDASEDSLFDLLSNRKPLPPKTAPSYTEMIEMNQEADDTVGGGLEDTFRGKARTYTEREVDPLDDSEIF